MKKPHVTFLVDYPNWAFDFVARSIASRLKDRYRFKIVYRCFNPKLDPEKIDLLYIFFWGESWHQQFNFPPSKVIKEVASFRWKDEAKYENLTAKAFVEKHLADARVITTPAMCLFEEISQYTDNIFLGPNGVETEYFTPSKKEPTGKMRIGWVGNPQDECKGLKDILIPAAKGFDFKWTSGSLSRKQLLEFYQDLDILVIASTSESQPLTLLEAMSCGVYIITTEVGIVPEILKSENLGLVVERSSEAFRAAFKKSEENLDTIRRSRKQIRAEAATQSWDRWAIRFSEIFDLALSQGNPSSVSTRKAFCRTEEPREIPPESNRTPLAINSQDYIIRSYWGTRYGGGLRRKISEAKKVFRRYKKRLVKGPSHAS